MTGPMIPIALAATALAFLAAPAAAATAHNSQAGAWGPNSHQCDATPYFAEGGCVSAAIQDDRRDPFVVPASPGRAGRRATSPGEPLLAPDE